MSSNKSRILWITVTLLGIAMLGASIWAIRQGDAALAAHKTVSFTDPDGDWVQATYYPGRLPAGLMLLPGFGSDQVAMQSIASEFARSGVHVLTLDYSGHGRSPGGLSFDNAATDRLAFQALLGREVFKQIAGLTEKQIIMLGHSMGARVALQTGTIYPETASPMILLGPSLNLAPNRQADFFASVDDNTLKWVQQLGPSNPPANILVISGEWEDVLPVESANLLLDRLTGQESQAGEIYGSLQDGNYRQWLLLPRLVHNYEAVSPRVIFAAKQWAEMVWGLPADGESGSASPLSSPAQTANRRIAWWLVGFAGLALALMGGTQWAGWRRPVDSPDEAEQPEASTVQAPSVTSLRRFLTAKLLLWLGAIPLALLLGAIIFFLPLNLPVFNLIYLLFIGAYGILLWYLYKVGHMPGTKGRLPFEKVRPRPFGYSLLALIIAAALLALSAAYARTGFVYIFPVNDRLWWLLIFTPLAALGFWIGLHEYRIITRAAPQSLWPRLAVGLIGLTPFILYTLLLALLGSISGMIAGLLGLAVLGLVLVFGTLVLRLTGHPWLAAILQALWLFWLILPQGPLFRV